MDERPNQGSQCKSGFLGVARCGRSLLKMQQMNERNCSSILLVTCLMDIGQAILPHVNVLVEMYQSALLLACYSFKINVAEGRGEAHMEGSGSPQSHCTARQARSRQMQANIL